MIKVSQELYIYIWIIVMYQVQITIKSGLCLFEGTLPYKCSWYIMWIMIMPDSDNSYPISFITS